MEKSACYKCIHQVAQAQNSNKQLSVETFTRGPVMLKFPTPDKHNEALAEEFPCTKQPYQYHRGAYLLNPLSSSLFSSGQAAVKLSGTEAADRAQCAAPD